MSTDTPGSTHIMAGRRPKVPHSYGANFRAPRHRRAAHGIHRCARRGHAQRSEAPRARALTRRRHRAAMRRSPRQQQRRGRHAGRRSQQRHRHRAPEPQLEGRGASGGGNTGVPSRHDTRLVARLHGRRRLTRASPQPRRRCAPWAARTSGSSCTEAVRRARLPRGNPSTAVLLTRVLLAPLSAAVSAGAVTGTAGVCSLLFCWSVRK